MSAAAGGTGTRWQARGSSDSSAAAAGVLARSRGETKPATLTLAGLARGALWLLVIALTAALLAYPREMSAEFSPVQSLEAVAPLGRFAVLYCTWAAALVALFLLQRNDEAGCWQGVALAAVFAIGYRGFWDVPLAPYGHSDSVLNTSTADYIRSTGVIPFGHANFVYLDFPGLHVLTAITASVAGIATADAAAVLTVLMDVLMAAALYIICLQLLGDVRWAGLGAVLGMQGSIIFPRLPFYPGTLGFVLASLFLLLLLRPRGDLVSRPSVAAAAIVLLSATAVTHLPTSALLLLVLTGVASVDFLRRSDGARFRFSTLLLYAVVPAAWLVYGTVQTFDDLVLVTKEVSANLQRENFLSELRIVGASNLGPSVPLWAAAVKLFWLFSLLGLGTAVAVYRLRRPSRLTRWETKALGALLGIGVLGGLATAASPGGSQFLRYPMYAPLLLAPLLLLTIRRLGPRLRTAALGLLLAALVVPALPTFLASYSTVRMDSFRSYERAPAALLARSGGAQELFVFAPALGYVPYVGYLPDARYAPAPELSSLKTAEQIWSYLDGQVGAFAQGNEAGLSVYVHSGRPRVYYRHNFRVAVDDPRWDALTQRLEGEARIYDNGYVTLYAAGGRP